MTETKLTVADDLVVSLDYSVRLSDGEVVASTEDREALEFLQGRGEIFPGLEGALYGMAVGDEKDVEVAPADGFGDRDPEAILLVPHDTFPSEATPQLGMRLVMRDRSGQAFEAYVSGVRPDGVLLDFNHPLAGETLFFRVKISSLRPATSEELAHGHPHSEEHED
jgi:FKBP-type peptidyl-prolyl cis-trans isomerase SlyD